MTKTRQKKEKDILDQMLDNIDLRGLTQDEVVGKGGLLKQLTGRILRRALETEMTEHLGYGKNSNAGDNSGNSRMKSIYVALGVNFEGKKEVAD